LIVTSEMDGKATAEVAHEILFKTWPTLKRWLEDERDFLVWRGELGAQRQEYDKATRADARQPLAARRWSSSVRKALLTGLPLDTAKKWLAERRGNIERADQAFIKASARADRVVALKWAILQRAGVALPLCIIFWLTYERELRGQWFLVTTFAGQRLTETALRDLKPGDVFGECVDTPSDDQKTHHIRRYCPDMVIVPSGEVNMAQRTPSVGGTIEPMIIAKPFAVSRFAVTFDQWDACVAGGGCDNYRPSDATWGRGTRPVIYVSLREAQQYVDWLNRMVGAKTYRLLSEAEFEYAASSTTAYPWGDEIGENNANCNGCKSEWNNKQTALSKPTTLASTTCKVMSGSGSRTAGTIIWQGRRITALRGQQLARVIRPVWFGAGPGAAVLRTSARPPATGAPPTAGSTNWASGSPGRLALEPYRGEFPWNMDLSLLGDKPGEADHGPRVSPLQDDPINRPDIQTVRDQYEPMRAVSMVKLVGHVT
jgi:formylglycine-generating enzyme required for sulfatase activity